MAIAKSFCNLRFCLRVSPLHFQYQLKPQSTKSSLLGSWQKQVGQPYEAMAWWLRCWIPNPGILCSKKLGGSKVESACHPSEVDQMSSAREGNSGNLVVKSKLPPRSGSVALRQLSPIHKKRG